MRCVGAILRPAAHGAWDLNPRRDISSWLARWFPRTPARSVVALKTPIKVELVAGKTYRWCVCGRSKKQIREVTR
ncbi:CDGSH iron-sulfur domain-containing protein 3, mitochondrial isoform X3 [Macaca fascicularis]|uniref:CDGSH iron-sulfur domain-containing protein 3, mitochondrial isoform X3 n=1 Tax=Macaca fascicularis TaxID=9541 RepID=UPI003D15C575